MGLFGTLLGFIGFGWGIGIGLVIGFVAFVYSLPSRVKDPVVKPVTEEDAASHKRMLNDIPYWVGQPDWERVGWLNKFVEQLWPYLNEAICKTIKDTVTPMIAQYKPPQITAVDFENLNMGSLPMLIDGVKVVDTVDDEIILQLHVKWAGNPNVKVAALAYGAKVTAQLVDVQVWGEVRVTMKPLVPVFPCFAGITVSLIQKPHIDFGLRLLNGDLMAIPGVYHYVQDTIRKIVADMMMWPRSLEVYKTELQDKKAVGMLYVKLIEGHKLKKTDLLGKTDPYIELWVDANSKKSRSQVKKSTQEPVWNESFQFAVTNPETERLIMQLFDKDAARSQKVGIMAVPIKDLVPETAKELWVDVKKDLDINSEANQKERGSIHIIATYRPFKSDEGAALSDVEETVEEVPEGVPEGGGLLVVVIHSAEDLEAKHSGTSNPYVKVRLRNEEHKTKVVKKNTDPEFEESFEFMLPEPPVDDVLHIQVFSKNKGVSGVMHGPKAALGHIDIPLKDVITNKRMNDMYQLTDAKKGQLKVELQWKSSDSRKTSRRPSMVNAGQAGYVTSTVPVAGQVPVATTMAPVMTYEKVLQ